MGMFIVVPLSEGPAKAQQLGAAIEAALDEPDRMLAGKGIGWIRVE